MQSKWMFPQDFRWKKCDGNNKLFHSMHLLQRTQQEVEAKHPEGGTTVSHDAMKRTLLKWCDHNLENIAQSQPEWKDNFSALECSVFSPVLKEPDKSGTTLYNLCTESESCSPHGELHPSTLTFILGGRTVQIGPAMTQSLSDSKPLSVMVGETGPKASIFLHRVHNCSNQKFQLVQGLCVAFTRVCVLEVFTHKKQKTHF